MFKRNDKVMYGPHLAEIIRTKDEGVVAGSILIAFLKEVRSLSTHNGRLPIEDLKPHQIGKCYYVSEESLTPVLIPTKIKLSELV